MRHNRFGASAGTQLTSPKIGVTYCSEPQPIEVTINLFAVTPWMSPNTLIPAEFFSRSSPIDIQPFRLTLPAYSTQIGEGCRRAVGNMSRGETEMSGVWPEFWENTP